ncbi:MAG: hypothetical protein IJJ38_06125 [Lachnospiraceae bacterium]|nr:hypothetical protein [Lachnospiraceae bacterium]
MEEYRNCDQCMRHCPVTALTCEKGMRRYEELTGTSYVPSGRRGGGFRERIRERQSRKREDENH